VFTQQTIDGLPHGITPSDWPDNSLS